MKRTIASAVTVIILATMCGACVPDILSGEKVESATTHSNSIPYEQGHIHEVGTTSEEIAVSFMRDLCEGNFVNMTHSYQYPIDLNSYSSFLINYQVMNNYYSRQLRVDYNSVYDSGAIHVPDEEKDKNMFARNGLTVTHSFVFEIEYYVNDTLGETTNGVATLMMDKENRILAVWLGTSY